MMQRRVWVLSGKANWCKQSAHYLLSTHDPNTIAWIPDQKAQTVLGLTLDALVFDAHQGLDSNALALSVGAIRGGGVLLLLTPPLSTWANFPDPDYQRFIPYLFENNPLTGRFIQRFVKYWQACPMVNWLNESASIPKPLKPAPILNHDWQWTHEQVQVLKLLQNYQGISLLLADRGRGKSTLLGAFAAQLSLQGLKVCITAPRKSAIQALEKEYYKTHTKPLNFLAPDELLQLLPELDVLIVDEAASIPLPLLMQMQAQYSRVIYSTTVQGYEGSGRGFILKFRKVLELQKNNLQVLTLNQPVRWDSDDSLEQLLKDSLLLGQSIATIPSTSHDLSTDIYYQLISQGELLSNELLLQKVFLLLVNAHYQTRPSDLRQLLDAPNISIHILEQDSEVIAVALLSREGGFDAEMTRLVFEGKRRPQGHLLPQTLTWHSKIPYAGELVCERVMRIAVLDDYQGQGLGKLLINYLISYSKQQRVDYIGVSYASTPELIRFWEKLGFQLMRKGFKRDRASGTYAAVQVLKLSERAFSLLPEKAVEGSTA
ncbi:MAG: GNAT family N-acetyltransferase [Thiofilum sp.]|uniref:GNAT family N-acetyltransferase n=1 Tax=Thiofilum sp. TaxID=2212733 RepID=UPI0025EC635B|nr:GNAT family N-acetyltransferase [Thiofilum sp.]MBK8452403.1 tRNA(Met) cytidine acetyltransferase [Thiofilum sp.]